MPKKNRELEDKLSNPDCVQSESKKREDDLQLLKFLNKFLKENGEQESSGDEFSPSEQFEIAEPDETGKFHSTSNRSHKSWFVFDTKQSQWILIEDQTVIENLNRENILDKKTIECDFGLGMNKYRFEKNNVIAKLNKKTKHFYVISNDKTLQKVPEENVHDPKLNKPTPFLTRITKLKKEDRQVGTVFYLSPKQANKFNEETTEKSERASDKSRKRKLNLESKSEKKKAKKAKTMDVSKKSVLEAKEPLTVQSETPVFPLTQLTQLNLPPFQGTLLRPAFSSLNKTPAISPVHLHPGNIATDSLINLHTSSDRESILKQVNRPSVTPVTRWLVPTPRGGQDTHYSQAPFAKPFLAPHQDVKGARINHAEVPSVLPALTATPLRNRYTDNSLWFNKKSYGPFFKSNPPSQPILSPSPKEEMVKNTFSPANNMQLGEKIANSFFKSGLESEIKKSSSTPEELFSDIMNKLNEIEILNITNAREAKVYLNFLEVLVRAYIQQVIIPLLKEKYPEGRPIKSPEFMDCLVNHLTFKSEDWLKHIPNLSSVIDKFVITKKGTKRNPEVFLHCWLLLKSLEMLPGLTPKPS